MKLEWTEINLSILLALAGWLVVHYLSSKRDRDIKQKDLITSYLIEAYRNIERACAHNEPLRAELNRGIESAIADVQLFGTSHQIELARNFTEEMNKDQFSDPRKLLATLRSDLRKELNLEELSINPEKIFHWRLIDKK